MFSLIAAFSTMPYKNKVSSQLSILENRIKNGTASITDRIKVFIINMFSSFVAPQVGIVALIVFIVLTIIT
jgi:hypothetical protein